ncbi:MAG: DotU family type IV/VI secretion system protein [Planctomycetes bacterium]|nr:DotU family type IV/VI secretion system protein [Planctomycetota bacterium]
MREDTAMFAYPVFASALRVREQLSAGRALEFEREHSRLKELLSAAAMTATIGPKPAGRASAPAAGFLGIRYALVCWVDELFTQVPTWRDRWNERKLEVELYGTNDRAWRFWDQAKLASGAADVDAMEVFFLCAQLGFRGTLADDPNKLREWSDVTRESLRELPVPESPFDLEPDPEFDAPPRRAEFRFERMLGVGAAVALVLIPIAAFILVSSLGGR